MKHAIMLVLLVVSATFAEPPAQAPVETTLGPKLYHDGDVVEITEVVSTSPRLEQGDTVLVRGRARLDSRDSAKLCLYLTQTEGDGREETEAAQSTKIHKGLQEFELKTTIKHKGALHLTFYDHGTGRPFGGTYFGTQDQMADIAGWDLSYYLK